MRSYHKGWQNKRPGFTRRVRWLQGQVIPPIRLEFMDEDGKMSDYYMDEATAQYDFDLFVEGKLSVHDIQMRYEQKNA
jgi:hypothetical protein